MKRLLFALALLMGPTTAAAIAGPPLICRPTDIGVARSLPWSSDGGWNGMVASYDTSHLVVDVLSILDAGAPAEVRIETLRRAAIYASRDPATGQTLLARLVQRTNGRVVPETALFDAGYFAEALQEAAETYAMIHGTHVCPGCLALAKRACFYPHSSVAHVLRRNAQTRVIEQGISWKSALLLVGLVFALMARGWGSDVPPSVDLPMLVIANLDVPAPAWKSAAPI